MGRIRRVIKILFWLMLFSSVIRVSADSDRAEVRRMSAQEFTAYLNTRIPELMKEEKIPGVAVALVQKGQILQVRGYGHRDKAKRLLVTADTVFQVGSISKPMTAWGIMKLVQDGRLRLDYPLDTYLIHWHLPKSKYDHTKVTISGLLSHTAGISIQNYSGYHPNKPLPTLLESLQGIRFGLERVFVKYPPGAGFNYSEGGYALLQLAMEEVTREKFAAYMEREIIKPLRMKDTSFLWRKDLQAKTAKGYDLYGFALPNYQYAAQAATGLYSTATDLAAWMLATIRSFRREGTGILKQETCRTMFTPVMDGYALGYNVIELPFGERFVGHNGSNHGWKAYYGLLAQEGNGIAILTNSDRGMALIGRVMDDWFAWQNLNRRTVVAEDLPLYFLDLYLRMVRLCQ